MPIVLVVAPDEMVVGAFGACDLPRPHTAAGLRRRECQAICASRPLIVVRQSFHLPLGIPSTAVALRHQPLDFGQVDIDAGRCGEIP